MDVLTAGCVVGVLMVALAVFVGLGMWLSGGDNGVPGSHCDW